MKVEFKVVPDLPTDSLNYEVLTEGVLRVQNVEGATCEIGLRRGGGSKFIIDALVDSSQHLSKVHMAIDPYGNIDYETTDHDVVKQDYTNTMRNEALMNLYYYTGMKNVNFYFFNLEDTEFFKRFSDGFPVYNEHKTIVNKYSFVHFDGPHSVKILKEEISFFNERADAGAVFVFDDVELYNHSYIDSWLKEINWELYRTSQRKWAYFKKA